MKRRSYRQIRADIYRIKWESKTLKQQNKLIAKQYEKLGRVVPLKARELRANQRDIQGYVKTLIKALDKKIKEEECKNDSYFIYLLEQLNNLQAKRHKQMKEALTGYDSQFVKEFLSGKVAILGRGVTTSVVNTNLYDIDRILKLADRNGIDHIKFMEQEISALTKSMREFNHDTPKEYIHQQILDILDRQGYKLTNKNLRDIETHINKIDWLGDIRVIKAMESRIETEAYSTYKEDWGSHDNRKLMEIVLDDLKRASHNNMVQYVRLIKRE